MTTAAIVLHPHPGMGGDKTHPLITTITSGLAARDITAVRPNLADPDLELAAPALRTIAEAALDDSGADRLVLIGYSWGSVVSSLVTMPGLAGRVLIAPPVGMMELGDDDRTATLVLVPAHDQFGGPEPVEAAVGSRTETTIEVIPGADHFLAGAIEKIADRTVTWVSELVAPSSEPG